MQKSASKNRWTEWHDPKISYTSEAPDADPASEKKTAEEYIVMLLDIHSANIANHIIDADIYHVEFVYFVDVVEEYMEVLDNEAAPIEEVCVEL